jgi:hypothetical protein
MKSATKRSEWTRPYCGLTHFDVGNRRWATIRTFGLRRHLVTFWDKDRKDYWTAATESQRHYSSLERAKADGEAWTYSGRAIWPTADNRCPACGQKIAS